MRILLTLLLIATSSSLAFAAPFVVCDPQDGVMAYVLEFDGKEYEGEALPDGSAKFDIGYTETGPHKVRLKAVNVFGDWSEWSDPFDFQRDIITKPSGIGLRTY